MKLYKCDVCGNVAEKVLDHGVPLMCCGQPMRELKANTTDGALEKHVPAAVVKGNVIEVVVGSVAHPMLAEHYITNIWVECGDQILRADLKPNEEPKAIFNVGDYKGTAVVYEYCNLHGLWKSEVEVK